MPRVSGRTGKVFAQVGGGTKFFFLELTNSGDNRKFTSGKSPWADTPTPRVRINGARSGLKVTVDNAVANDTVDITAGTAYIAGVEKTIAAGSLATLARPLVAGNVLITAITADSTGALAKVAGTEGASGGAIGAAGGQPFIPVGSILLALVALSGTAAAVVLASEIDTTAMERADIPGWEPDFFNGTISLQIPLAAIHTGTVPRKVYAEFTQVTLSEIFDLSEWMVEVSKDTADTFAMGDTFKKAVPVIRSWSGSARGFVVSTYWFDAANRDGYMLVELQYHENAPTKFQGIANVSWSMSVPATGAVTEDIKFTGNGELVEKPIP